MHKPKKTCAKHPNFVLTFLCGDPTCPWVGNLACHKCLKEFHADHSQTAMVSIDSLLANDTSIPFPLQQKVRFFNSVAGTGNDMAKIRFFVQRELELYVPVFESLVNRINSIFQTCFETLRQRLREMLITLISEELQDNFELLKKFIDTDYDLSDIRSTLNNLLEKTTKTGEDIDYSEDNFKFGRFFGDKREDKAKFYDNLWGKMFNFMTDAGPENQSSSNPSFISVNPSLISSLEKTLSLLVAGLPVDKYVQRAGNFSEYLDKKAESRVPKSQMDSKEGVVIDIDNLKVKKLIPMSLDSEITSLHVLPRLRRSYTSQVHHFYATGHIDGSLAIWRITGSVHYEKFRTHSLAVSVMASWSSDEEGSEAFLVSAGDDSSLIVWDLNTFELLAKSNLAHAKYIASLNFVKPTPEAKYPILVSSGMDGTMKFWDLKTLAPLGTILRGHNYTVEAIYQMRGREREFLTVSLENCMKWWNTKKKTTVAIWKYPSRETLIKSLSLSLNCLVLVHKSGLINLVNHQKRKLIKKTKIVADEVRTAEYFEHLPEFKLGGSRCRPGTSVIFVGDKTGLLSILSYPTFQFLDQFIVDSSILCSQALAYTSYKIPSNKQPEAAQGKASQSSEILKPFSQSEQWTFLLAGSKGIYFLGN